MRTLGINYDTGFGAPGRRTTHEPFDAESVRLDLRAIREELHCTAVRITGGRPERLELAARLAAEVGLEVWFCPFTCDLTADEMHALLDDCAERAERLRKRGAEVVFFTGSELAIANRGYLPGDTLFERAANLTDVSKLRANLPAAREAVAAFLRVAAERARARFGGRLSYAALPFEPVDWSLFDIIATDAGYRSAEHAPRYREQMRAFVAAANGKPTAITEFGCTTYRGAADRGPKGDEIIDWGDGGPARLNRVPERDEHEQAVLLPELLDIFHDEGIDAAFIYTFARFDLPHRATPADDFDLASAGIVKVFDDGTRAPKESFRVVAAYYARARERLGTAPV